MLKKKLLFFSALIGAVVLFGGCYKTVTIVENPGNSITAEMSFTNDINPIFQKSCALSGCHASGAKEPNLSDGNAYKSLVDGNYFKAADPDNSVLILWLTGKKSPVMPLGNGPDQEINAKVYAWIKQGAKNN